MKTFYRLFILLFFSFLFVSCDPAQNMHFINKTDSDAKVKIVLNPKFENYRLKELAKNDSIVFNIKEKDTANIYFGIGTWSDSEINEVTNSIENIEVESKDIKTMYKSKKSITEILKDNRKGFWWHTDIEIEIK